MPTNDASSMALFQATALRGEQTIEISKAALLDVLGKCVEAHAPSARPSRTHLVAINARASICET